MTQRPLAEQLRPGSFEEFIGQEHLLGEGKPLSPASLASSCSSMILYGPPGTGKTTLARLISAHTGFAFETLSAVVDGIGDVRKVVQRASARGETTLLFVDEVHRFNKAQQDAFLPHIESGLLILVGATTENPSFSLNNALLSRVHVHVLKALENSDLEKMLNRALAYFGDELGVGMVLENDARQWIIHVADGDGRRLLNLLDGVVVNSSVNCDQLISIKDLESSVGTSVRRFDKNGDQFYDLVSAFHKSIRGSDANASLYWLARLLDGGTPADYISRRLIRIATEDIGNADPRALEISLNAADAYNRLGSPEGDLALAQATCYLAISAKSNAVYRAFNQAREDVKHYGSADVPNHLRNAPTTLAKREGHGAEYRYAHDEDGGYAAGEKYFPEKMPIKKYYKPVDRGLEKKIAEKLQQLEALDLICRQRHK